VKGRRAITVLLILLGGVAYVGTNRSLETKRKKASVSVYNRRAGGTSIYADFLNQVSPGSARLGKSPYLYSEDLEGAKALIILSPTNVITKREASVVADFVDAGGTLILGIHDQESQRQSGFLIEALGGNVTIVNDTRFKNGQSVLLSPKQDTFVFKAAETYEFYSSVLLDRSDCRGGNFDCYVYEVKHGKGKTILLAGLPFFGNVLIGRQANKEATLRLAAAYPKVQIDEYHHFFTDQTLWSLLWKPAFSIPILGGILGALLLLAFGHSEFHERSTTIGRTERPPRTLHGLNESIVYRVFEKPRAFPMIVGQHREFLARLFPGKKKELEKIGEKVRWNALGQREFLLVGRRFLASHRKWMKGER
jgi:hypothetical protein